MSCSQYKPQPQISLKRFKYQNKTTSIMLQYNKWFSAVYFFFSIWTV